MHYRWTTFDDLSAAQLYELLDALIALHPDAPPPEETA